MRLAAVVVALCLGAEAFAPSHGRARCARVKSAPEDTEEVQQPEAVAEEPAPAPPAPAPTPAPAAMPMKKGALITGLPDFESGAQMSQNMKNDAEEKAKRIKALPGMETQADLKTLAAELCPAVPFWDPLGLSVGGFWNEPDEATIGFLRQAEIKHGRVAMAGFVGFLVHAQGIKWGFPMTLDGQPWPEASSVPALWDKLPQASKWQIILFVGALEWYDEYHFDRDPEKPQHYMRGGMPGKYPAFKKGSLPWNLFDPFNFSKNRSEEAKAKGRLAEINNGRLAMIGLMGFIAESRVPGSVPVLKGLIAPYEGNVMVPFETDFSLFAGP